jgi:uracil-DNA glycosylase
MASRHFAISAEPGNDENRVEKPLSVPAGKLLDKALFEVKLIERSLWTNAVKHFKWEPKCKRRIPQAMDVTLPLYLIHPGF